MNFGSHMHSAFELWARQQEFGTSEAEIEEKVARLLEEEFRKEPTEDGDFRTLNWALEIYRQHSKRFGQTEYKLMRYKEPQPCKYCEGRGYNTSEVDGIEIVNNCLWCNETGRSSIMAEVPFALPLFTYTSKSNTALKPIPVFYHGFVDLPVVIGEQTFILDYKTASRLGSGFFEDKKMSAQQKGYCWAFENLTGIKVAGFLVRALRTIEPPIYVVKGEASKKGEFKKIEDWWDESIQEERFYLGQGELEEWRLNTISLVEQFMGHYERDFMPQTGLWGQCVGKYGKCAYFDACSTFPASDRSLILNSGLYKQKASNANLIPAKSEEA